MTWRASVLTLFEDMFPGSLGLSLAGDALAKSIWSLETKNIRDHGLGKHRAVDDTPAGGGAGMVLRADVVAAAIDAVSPSYDARPRLLLTPRGKPLTQARVRELAAGPGVVIICGRFEGFDERIVGARNLEEISIGDYVLSGGEPAALVLLDACVRLLPGVMGASASGDDESFSESLLEYPQYTKPREFESIAIPDVLLGGDHGKIARWRRAQAEASTKARRPDLLTDREPPGSHRTLARQERRGPKSKMPTLDFWYEFASTYSYPTAMRVEEVARASGVTVRWRPFLLGPIFGAQGWTTSPFNLFPAKGANMWRDLERVCARSKLPFVRPDPFPQNSLLAARVACAIDDAHRPKYSRAIYTAEFGAGKNISGPEIVAEVLTSCGLDAHEIIARATSDEGKAALKAQSTAAAEHDIFGAPSFVTADGELFWGNDRLEDAVAWAAKTS